MHTTTLVVVLCLGVWPCSGTSETRTGAGAVDASARAAQPSW